MPRPLQSCLTLLLMITVTPLALAEGDASAGQAVFQARCSGCHAVGPDARAGFGPQLNGVVGRQAGSTQYQYSDALRNAGFAWSEEKLKAYIDDAKAVVPGTRMNFWWIGSDQKLDDLVTYLATQPAR